MADKKADKELEGQESKVHEDRAQERFAELLNDAYESWRRDFRRKGDHAYAISRANFARYLGVSPVTLSTWMNAKRFPTPELIEILAANRYVGMRIFEVLGLSPRLPADPELRFLVEHWSDLSEEQQEAQMRFFKEEVSLNGGGKMELVT